MQRGEGGSRHFKLSQNMMTQHEGRGGGGGVNSLGTSSQVLQGFFGSRPLLFVHNVRPIIEE